MMFQVFFPLVALLLYNGHVQALSGLESSIFEPDMQSADFNVDMKLGEKNIASPKSAMNQHQEITAETTTEEEQFERDLLAEMNEIKRQERLIDAEQYHMKLQMSTSKRNLEDQFLAHKRQLEATLAKEAVKSKRREIRWAAEKQRVESRRSFLNAPQNMMNFKALKKLEEETKLTARDSDREVSTTNSGTNQTARLEEIAEKKIEAYNKVIKDTLAAETRDVESSLKAGSQKTKENVDAYFSLLSNQVSEVSQAVSRYQLTHQEQIRYLQNVEVKQRYGLSFFAKYLRKTWHWKNECFALSTVVWNYQNAYNSANGVFKAPVNGMYFFMASSGPNGLCNHAFCVLNTNGGRMGHAEAYEDDKYDVTVVHGLDYLAKGKYAWLSAWTDGFYRSDIALFSGFLVNPR